MEPPETASAWTKMVHVIKKGLDLPIQGAPRQEIETGPAIRTVAVVGADYVGMKPTMEVAEGDRVKLGQLLFTDKKNEGVRFTSPAAGKVKAVSRGDKRVFLSVEIEVEGDDAVSFTAHDHPGALERSAIVEQLNEAGLWTALRRRPYSKVPALDEQPHTIFVTAIDTNPLAADPAVVLAADSRGWSDGLAVLTALTEGWVHICRRAGSSVTDGGVGRCLIQDFSGPHPSGLPGTHIHLLEPASLDKPVWYVNYQDVLAIGRLFRHGKLDPTRVVALSGPRVADPVLVRTVLGASIADLTAGRLKSGTYENRVISGSVLSGRTAVAPVDYLGRYHGQVSAIEEGRERELLGWHMPGTDKFSVKKVFAATVVDREGGFDLTTSTGGSRRAMVPVGSYEQVMPLDILPTFLLRSLIIGDTDQAQALGALELDEEDLALCTFVCPGKYEYGPLLRSSLETIEREG